MASEKHKKKTKGKKAAKRSAAMQKKSAAGAGGADDGFADGGGGAPATKQRNPKAFTVKSRGRAKLQRARTAEKEQKRMHGARWPLPLAWPAAHRAGGARGGPLAATNDSHPLLSPLASVLASCSIQSARRASACGLLRVQQSGPAVAAALGSRRRWAGR